MLKVQKQVFIDLDIKKEIGYKRYISDISEVCECSAAVSSGKGLGTNGIFTQQNNNGELGDTMQ